MNVKVAMELTKQYGVCAECGSDKVGGKPSEGTLVIEDHVFTRSCKCGWSITIDRSIQISGTVTRKMNGRTTGIANVLFNKTKQEKYVNLNELKHLSGAKRANQTKLMNKWLNTTEGKKWAEETEDCSYFFDAGGYLWN